MEKKLYRSETDKVLAGVCGGIAEYTGIDATVVRLIWVLFGFISVGLIAYIVAALIIPQRPYDYYQNQAYNNPNNNNPNNQNYNNYNNQGNYGYQNQNYNQAQNFYNNQANSQNSSSMNGANPQDYSNSNSNQAGSYQSQNNNSNYAEEAKAQENIYDVENFEETKKSE